MKTLLVVLFASAMFNISCEKCGTCTTTTTTTITPNIAGYPQTTKQSVDLCGSDYKEADGRVQNVSSVSGSQTVKVTSKCDCE